MIPLIGERLLLLLHASLFVPECLHPGHQSSLNSSLLSLMDSCGQNLNNLSHIYYILCFPPSSCLSLDCKVGEKKCYSSIEQGSWWMSFKGRERMKPQNEHSQRK